MTTQKTIDILEQILHEGFRASCPMQYRVVDSWNAIPSTGGSG